MSEENILIDFRSAAFTFYLESKKKILQQTLAFMLLL